MLLGKLLEAESTTNRPGQEMKGIHQSDNPTLSPISIPSFLSPHFVIVSWLLGLGVPLAGVRAGRRADNPIM